MTVFVVSGNLQPASAEEEQAGKKLVSRYEDRPNIGFWPIALHERLPVVRVPLAAPDPDAHLDLQAVLDRTYDAAGFGTYIYSETPEPPLSADAAAWAAGFLPKRK